MPEQSTDIILVTHGLTEWNKQNRIQGHVDIPLCKEGHYMAQCLARRLVNFSIAAIYSSDLQRAVQTASMVGKSLGLSIHTDPALREGRSLKQEDSSEYPLLPFTKEVETEQDVLHRMQRVLEGIAIQNSGQRVLVVSHGGAVNLFITNILLSTFSRDSFLNKRTAVNLISYHNKSWICKILDDDTHLAYKSL